MSKASPGGKVFVHEDECKGCALCVEACPVHGLVISQARLNRIGYHPVEFIDGGCTGCGVCFYACPEPGALHVVRPQPAGKAGSDGDEQPAKAVTPAKPASPQAAKKKGGETR